MSDKNYPMGNGNIPPLAVNGAGIAEAWENSVVELHDKGLWYKRGGKKDQGKIQTDSTMMIGLMSPARQPFLHKMMGCGAPDLFEYQMELLGAKDSWVDPSGESLKWEYHYHERLVGHPGENGLVDQLSEIKRLMLNRPTTRRMTAVTWAPARDYTSGDPPCLQRIWFGMVPDESRKDNQWVMNMNYDFRSRNVMFAAPMNMLGLMTLQYDLVDKLQEEGMNIKAGRIIDKSDSYHVSARDQSKFHAVAKRIKDSWKKDEGIEKRSFDPELTLDLMQEERANILIKLVDQTRKNLEEYGKMNQFDAEETKIHALANRVDYLNKQMFS